MLALLIAAALQSPCGGSVAKVPVGATFTGQAVRIVDGDGLWLQTGEGPQACYKIRIADFYAPEMDEPGGNDAKEALRTLATGRTITCAATRGQRGSTASYDRLIAVCRVNGVSLGKSLRDAGVIEGGNGWR